MKGGPLSIGGAKLGRRRVVGVPVEPPRGAERAAQRTVGGGTPSPRHTLGRVGANRCGGEVSRPYNPRPARRQRTRGRRIHCLVHTTSVAAAIGALEQGVAARLGSAVPISVVTRRRGKNPRFTRAPCSRVATPFAPTLARLRPSDWESASAVMSYGRRTRRRRISGSTWRVTVSSPISLVSWWA